MLRRPRPSSVFTTSCTATATGGLLNSMAYGNSGASQAPADERFPKSEGLHPTGVGRHPLRVGSLAVFSLEILPRRVVSALLCSGVREGGAGRMAVLR